MIGQLSRRQLLAGVGVLGLASSVSKVATSMPAANWLPGSSKDHWLHTVRLQASTQAEDVTWWYTGRIYAQVGESEPKHLFNLEGTEIYWCRKLPNGNFLVSARTLTFFRDPTSGAMLRHYENPYTGKTNAVAANRIGGRDHIHYSSEGWRFPNLSSANSDRSEAWQLEWHQSEDLAWFTSSRFIRQFPQPWLESMTVFCDGKDLLDAGQTNVPAHFTSTYLAPWPRWMDMGDRPGHLVWHSSGRKLTSLASLSDEYRRRVEKEYDGVLTAHPDSFD